MTGEPAMAPPTPRFLPLLLLLFFGSGCAALIYEIVWFQLLQFVIGSSAVSLAVLLGTFMGGMCIGSLALPRIVSAAQHPLRVYAALELIIGAAGALVLYGVPAVGSLYTSLVGHGMPGILLRALVCVVCLLPPTICMGATLPAIARFIQNTPRGVAWLGFFYGGNTLGAVAGCLIAGFYLLRIHDMATATFTAVALNVTVAALALVIAGRSKSWQPAPTDAAPASHAPTGSTSVLIAIALSGLTALGAEVIWTRLLSLLLGATVYTFSIILAVFLVGLGLGSAGGAALARSAGRPRLALAICQLLLGVAIAWSAHAISVSLPYWPITAPVVGHAATKFEFDLARCAWAILPATILWGASFPLALAAASSAGEDTARLVGRAYAANTVGAIVGAVATSMLLIPLLGTQPTQQVFIGLTVIAGLIALAPRQLTVRFALGAVAVVGIAAGAVITLPRIPWELVAYGRQIASTDYGAKALYFGEGMNASVAVSETPGGARFFHVSGKTEASSLEKDMRLQRMLGHIPALLHPHPESVLIVGCGAGVTAGSFVLHPTIRRIVICDIEPLIPGVVATYFRDENYNVVHDPRVQIVYDDARHYIATTSEKFDIITSDPIHPWVKGSAVLYSQEYFNLCRARLNPGGLVTQWVPFYEADRRVVQSQIATFFSAFPEGTIWGNDDEGFGYDTVMLGQAAPLRVDVVQLETRMSDPAYARVRDSLAPLGLGTAIELLSTYAGRQTDLHAWLASAEINRDRNLRLQYLAGLQLESHAGADAYGEMLGHRKFPDDIFIASAGPLQNLRRLMESPGLRP
jgi:spermidine synthase